MSDNKIQMVEKDNPPRKKEEYSTLTITVSINGEPKNDRTCKSASVKMPKPLVKKIDGPFNEKDELVEEMIAGTTYIFKATEFQKSTMTPIKHIWWAEQLDDGEITDLEYKKGENPYLDDKKVVCFKYKAKKAEKIRIYAYVSSPAKNVSIEKPVISTEMLLAVGTEQHSASYGNKLMFPAQAVREIREITKKKIISTILIFTDGYNKEQLEIIERDAKKHTNYFNYVKVNSVTTFIEYINKGNDFVDREFIKVSCLKIFSHGLASTFDFGLDGNREISQSFVKGYVDRLSPSSFDEKITIYSYACRTGNSDTRILASSPTYTYGKDWYDIVKPSSSLAQELADHLEATVFAFICRTDYNPTWNDRDDEKFQEGYIEIEDESVNGKLYKPWDWDETLWHSNGAYSKPKAGDSPKGLPFKMYIFRKDEEPILAK